MFHDRLLDMTVDVGKLVEFWRGNAEEDIQIARENFANRRYSFAMFLAHLSLEKALKALVIRETKTIPPRIHNLTSLAERAGLSLDQETMTFLSAMDNYQMAGRYPEPRSPMISRLDAERDLKRADSRMAKSSQSP